MSDSDKCPKCEATMERSVLREAPSYYGVERHEVGGFECVTRQLVDANNRYRDLVEALGITSHQSDADVIAYARQVASDAIGGEVKAEEIERLTADLATNAGLLARLHVAVSMVAKHFRSSGDDDLTEGERQALALCREAAEAAKETR